MARLWFEQITLLVVSRIDWNRVSVEAETQTGRQLQLFMLEMVVWASVVVLETEWKAWRSPQEIEFTRLGEGWDVAAWRVERSSNKKTPGFQVCGRGPTECHPLIQGQVSLIRDRKLQGKLRFGDTESSPLYLSFVQLSSSWKFSFR